jgi:hypothetical protein
LEIEAQLPKKTVKFSDYKEYIKRKESEKFEKKEKAMLAKADADLA